MSHCGTRVFVACRRWPDSGFSAAGALGLPESQGPSVSFGPLAKSLLRAWIWPAAQLMPAGGRATAAFAPQGARSGPDIADCLEIRTCFLLRPSSSHAALVRAVRIAACKAAAGDCKPNMAKFEPAIAVCRCNLPIGNCQVLCIFMYMWTEASAHVHAGRGPGGGPGGSMRILALVEIKPTP